MPDILIPNAKSHIRDAVTGEDLDTARWWRGNQPVPTFGAVIAQYLTRSTSWHKDLLRWGNEEDVLVEVWSEDGQVISISARTDLRHADRASCEGLMLLAAGLSCHLYVPETQAVVAPELDLFLQQAGSSHAARFCRNSRGFLEELARELNGD